VLIANLDPTLDRSGPPTDVVAVLDAFPYPLATREVAAVLAAPLQPVDDEATEALLIDAAADGRVRRAVSATVRCGGSPDGAELDARPLGRPAALWPGR
jgi:hypothetical protein